MSYASIALTFALMLPLATGSAARGADVTAHAITPLAMQLFCRERPDECRSSGPTSVEWTPQLAALLIEVNRTVNGAIRPRADPTHTWDVNPASGDCNDFVLSKRSRLIRLGVPAGALRFAVTTTRGGAPHAILLVKTSAGDYVLDNLSNETRTLQKSGYAIRLVSTADPLRWTRS